MLSTRKVNTYGRRSTAIVPAPAGIRRPLFSPTPTSDRICDTPPSEGDSSSVIVFSPPRTRAQKLPMVSKLLAKAPAAKGPSKKENLLADLSALSISSPAAARPWKRKILLVPSPKLRGSPRQRRIEKKVKPSTPSSKPRSPLLPKKQVVGRSGPMGLLVSNRRREPTIELSDDSCVVPGGYPPIHSTGRMPAVALTAPPAPPVPVYETPARLPNSILVLSDSSDSDIPVPPDPRTRPLQPLARQYAMVASPPLRLNIGARPSAGSNSRLSGGSLASLASPRSSSPVRYNADDMPSPIDSDDELAFMDAVAELESRPRAAIAPAVRTKSEPKLLSRSTRTLDAASSALGAAALTGLTLANVEPSASKSIPSGSGLKPVLTSTKSMPLSNRLSMVAVELPVPKKNSKPKPKPAKLSPTEQPTSTSEPQRDELPATKPKSSKRTSADAKPKPTKEPKPKSKPIVSKPPAPPEPQPISGPSTTIATTTTNPAITHTTTKSAPARPKALRSKPSSPSPALVSLLDACSQSEPIDLDAFVSTFSTDEIHKNYPASSGAGSRRHWHKIGEASYSEVFGLGGVVVKVVPLRMEARLQGKWADGEGPCVSEMEDVEKEIAVTRAMGDIQEGFIKLIKAHVARGPYPQELLKLWDAYHREIGSESIRPDSFTASQLYVLLVLPDGGPDLEHYSFAPRTCWRAAAGIFWQVAHTLARAEALVQFEHRDLHWGQILIQNVSNSKSTTKSKSKSKSKTKSKSKLKGSTTMTMDSCEQSGVRVTLIDLGLSRMNTHTPKPWFTELEPEIFEGQGDYQFDVYRMMKAHCFSRVDESGWETYRPLTNVMWLHYLAHQLLYTKGLRKPDTIVSRYHTADDVQAETHACACLVDIENVLAAAVARTGGPRVTRASGDTLVKAAKGVNVRGVELASAQGVLKWGAEMKWVQPV